MFEALTFDDVLLEPHSTILPTEADTATRITKSLIWVSSFISRYGHGDRCEMAIAGASQWHGVLHRNLTPQDQAAEVTKVKKFESAWWSIH